MIIKPLTERTLFIRLNGLVRTVAHNKRERMREREREHFECNQVSAMSTMTAVMQLMICSQVLTSGSCTPTGDSNHRYEMSK